jgi:DNA-binding protein VF530
MPDVPEPDVPEPDVPEPDVPEPDVPEPDVPEPKAAESPQPELPEREITNEQPSTPRPQPNDPLHGITLEALLTELVAHYGWDNLGRRITINCFNDDPSIKSSLKFLRKTPWARKKVEDLFLFMRREAQKQ